MFEGNNENSKNPERKVGHRHAPFKLFFQQVQVSI